MIGFAAACPEGPGRAKRPGDFARPLECYISKGSIDRTGWPTEVRYSSSCSGSSVQTVSSAIMSVN